MEKEDDVEKRIKELRKIKEDKDSGKQFCIPFDNFPKLKSSIPGIIRGNMSLISASSGVGKTKFTKAFFVMEPLKYAIKHNINVKILYFALEESRGEFIDSVICTYISEQTGIRMDARLLQGYRDKSLSEENMKKIEDCQEDIKKLMSNIEIIDSVYNPYGIYAHCRDFADRRGNHHYKDKEFIKKKSDGTIERKTNKVYSHYEPDDPDEFVIVVVDHISLLQPEKDKETGKNMSLREAMSMFSTKFALGQMTKHWNWHVCQIQQQAADSESEQFTNKGDSLVQKTEPSLSGLGDNKIIQRDCDLIIGVYSPDRFGFRDYHGYNISRMKDTFRVAKILKNRWGPPNKYHSFLFDGATNRFKELPKGSESAEMVPYYNAADKLLGRTGPPKPLKNFGK